LYSAVLVGAIEGSEHEHVCTQQGHKQDHNQVQAFYSQIRSPSW